MRWFKKIVRAILCLIPVFSIFFLVNGDSSALQHDYKALWLGDIPIPVVSNDSVDFTTGDPDTVLGYGLGIGFANGYMPDLNSIHPRFTDNIYFGGDYSLLNGRCTPSPSDDTPSIDYYNMYYYLQYNAGNGYISLDGPTLFTSNYDFPANSELNCYKIDFDWSSTPFNPRLSEWSSYSTFATKPFGNYPQSDYFSFDQIKTAVNNLSPYPNKYTSLKLHDTSVSSATGQTYSGSFNFNRLFDGIQIQKFRELSIPLFTDDGYFLDSSNLYQGREFEWKFYFDFKGNFSWNEDISNGYIKLKSYAFQSGAEHSTDIDFTCTANLISVISSTQLEISCPVILEHDYLYFIPYLVLHNDPYLWDTDNIWDFYSTYLITDGDSTPGQSFNTQGYGDTWSATIGVGGSGVDDIGSCAVGDFSCLLSRTFSFSIPFQDTPLGNIFSSFTDSMSCVPIPTIASMLHSNETQICPWFNSTIRNITTPILTLVSVMLTFGFLIRWLSSSSGNETGGGY